MIEASFRGTNRSVGYGSSPIQDTIIYIYCNVEAETLLRARRPHFAKKRSAFFQELPNSKMKSSPVGGDVS